jgi:NADH-quinone oxidoreductase subunit C
MAESSNEHPAGATPDPAPSDSTPEEPTPEDGPSEEDKTLALLSQPRRELLTRVAEVLQEYGPKTGALNDLPQVTVPAERIVAVCRRAKDDPELDFKMLLCMSCVDYQEYFQMVYFLHSLEREQTLVVKADVSYEEPSLPSLTSVWQAAEWYEREAHDLFGIAFEGHPDLSPLLLYEGFEGYPGRKEFPFYEYQEF